MRLKCRLSLGQWVSLPAVPRNPWGHCCVQTNSIDSKLSLLSELVRGEGCPGAAK